MRVMKEQSIDKIAKIGSNEPREMTFFTSCKKEISMNRPTLSVSVWSLVTLLSLLFTGCPSIECLDEGCKNIGDDDAAQPTPTPVPTFSATLKVVAPYGWSGTFYVFPSDGHPNAPNCEGVKECKVDIESAGSFESAITGDTFKCVNQMAYISNNGESVELTDPWINEGQCGLAPPDGDYGTYDVTTEINNDQVWIWLGSWGAIVTGDIFFYEDDEYLLEGQISQDLTEIYYHRVSY